VCEAKTGFLVSIPGCWPLRTRRAPARQQCRSTFLRFSESRKMNKILVHFCASPKVTKNCAPGIFLISFLSAENLMMSAAQPRDTRAP
jgi:hypothetical protein